MVYACLDLFMVFLSCCLKKEFFLKQLLKDVTPLGKEPYFRLSLFDLLNSNFRWPKEPVAVPEATLHHHPNPT
jgi:hypothetical protein